MIDSEIIYKLIEISTKAGLTTSVKLCYNSGGDLIYIKKYSNGEWYSRKINDPDVSDYVIDKEVTYEDWVV